MYIHAHIKNGSNEKKRQIIRLTMNKHIFESTFLLFFFFQSPEMTKLQSYILFISNRTIILALYTYMHTHLFI